MHFSIPSRSFLLCVAICLGFILQSLAQSTAAPAECGLPGGLKSSSGHNLFSPQQEEWLGEQLEKELRSEYRVIDDPENYLAKVADRLRAQLPPSDIQYRFVIIDAPELNSYGIPGGRIFIHRRMLAFVQNEDELAALLGHEMGHIFDHHVALRVSNFYRQMGVTTLGDRDDVLKHQKEFEDTARRIKHVEDEKREAEEQVVADRLAFYALKRAGYDPEKGIAFFDRLLQTKGKAGNFWTDFLGHTSPNGKRLREMLKSEASLPANCIASLPSDDAAHFAQWQKDMIEASKLAAQPTELPGLVRKVALQQQLRADLYNIQFSPDGKYLLAQDESSIFVAARDPLANLFRIDAFDAHAANFTPDSTSIVFYDQELRVEKWDVASARRVWVREVTIPNCFQAELSPSGAYLGCIDPSFNLRLVEVATNKVLVEHKQFYQFTNFFEWYRYVLALIDKENFRIFDLKFSPDERYFIAAQASSFLAYDLQQRGEAKVSSRIRDLARIAFTFVAPNELAGLHYAGGHEMTLMRVTFPDGDKIDEFKVQAEGWLSTSGNRDALLMRPAGAYPVAIVDLKARKITQAFKNPAFAVYGDVYAGEQNSGEVAIFDTANSKLQGRLALPQGLLGASRTSVFSSDGKWLAVSQGSRGSLWNLETGARMFLARGFDGALFENDHLITKFSLDPPNPSRVFDFDLKNNSNRRLFDVIDAAGLKARSWQWGNLLIKLRPENDKSVFGLGTATLQVSDVHDDKLLWERKLHHGLPRFFYTPTAITLMIWDWGGIKEAAHDDADLTARLNRVENKETSFLLQSFEPATGKLLGSVLVDTGKLSFRVDGGYAAGNEMFVSDAGNHRVLVYSISDGVQHGSVVGHAVAASLNGDKLLVENESGSADLYDTATLKSQAHFNFPARIVDAGFAADGSLYVLTADQNVYQLNFRGTQSTVASQ